MILLSSKELWSQNSIKGIVLDEIEAPVMGADIYIEQLHIGTISNENGAFELQNIPQGTHKLSISFVGFNTQNIELNTSIYNNIVGTTHDYT